MKRNCLYRCPKCGTEKTIIRTAGVDRIVTCAECTDDEGWRIVMKLMEAEGDD